MLNNNVGLKCDLVHAFTVLQIRSVEGAVISVKLGTNLDITIGL